MRLTTLTDYALRVLVYSGHHTERLCTISEIATAFDISQAHLMKVSQLLAQQGWITTVRGKHGGLHLSKAPDQIPLGAVVRSIEPDFNLVECLGPNNQCRLTGGCALTCILNGALKAFLQHLDCYTLADVITQPQTASLRHLPLLLNKLTSVEAQKPQGLNQPQRLWQQST